MKINALEYGFKNDGITRNDAIMEKYIKEDYRTPLYFPRGVYVFDRGFNFPDLCFLELNPEAELKLDGDEIQEFFITLRKGPVPEGMVRSGYAFNCYIHGGYINANNKAKNGLGFYLTRHCVFDDFVLKNVLEKGIVTRTEKHPNGQTFFRNVLIENDYGIKGTIGLYDNAFDTHCDQLEVVNFETGYYTICGRFNHCAAWLRDPSIIENSLFAYIDGWDISFETPAVDTYRYGFKIANPGYSVTITDMLWINNQGVYPLDLQEKYPRTLFMVEDDNCVYKVNGLKIDNAEYLDFSNKELPKSSFLNVRVHYSCDPYTKFKYFRNDNDGLAKVITTSLDSETNFDELITPGYYECSFTPENKNASAPEIDDTGVMEIVRGNNFFLQKFMGSKSFAHRIYKDGKWQNWVISK